jgi:hypothetical protein
MKQLLLFNYELLQRIETAIAKMEKRFIAKRLDYLNDYHYQRLIGIKEMILTGKPVTTIDVTEDVIKAMGGKIATISKNYRLKKFD